MPLWFSRYTLLTESDATFKIITTKDNSLSNNYSCSFCPAEFLKIRDKVKHDRDVHGVQSNILPIKFVSDRYLESLKIDDSEKNNTVTNGSSIADINNIKTTQVFEKNSGDIQSTECNISFKTTSEKIEHDNKLHDMIIATQQSKHSIVSTNYDEIHNENLNIDLETKNTSLKSGQDINNCFKLETTHEERNAETNLNLELNKIKDEQIESNTQKDFKCYYCNKQFTSKNLASKHVRTHMNMLDIKKSVTKSDVFDKYKVMIDNKLYYKCDQCNYAVEGRRYKFVYHMRVHTGEKPYKCEICNKQFRTAAFLRRHIVCFHERVRGYQCDICGRSFSEKRNVDDHRRTHTGERPFVCETCGKSFAQRSSMKIHWKQMHESIKAHKCQYCEKSFIRRCHLVAHLTHHTGVRNYVCAVCGKAFLRSGTLKGHTAVHSSERPFHCTICGDSFKLKKHLKQHGRVHGNQPAFGSVSQLELTSTDNDQLGS